MSSSNQIRACLALQIAAAAVTGYWAYLDRTQHMSAMPKYLALPICWAAMLGFLLPGPMALILAKSQLNPYKKVLVAAVSAAAFFAQFLAAMPLVQ